MSKRDTYHQAVRNALIREGWRITADPLHIEFGGVEFYVDLGAEKLIAAERGDERIAVEVKSFVGASDIAEFYTALGQFLSYRLALEREQPERQLYVAVPEDAWTTFFALPFAVEMRQRHQLLFIVFDPQQEAIRQWTRS
jgi:hypothetical protein